MSVFRSGESETLKGSVHGALGLLALVCVGYNAIAWSLRREPHLAVNVGLYGLLVALEAKKVGHHCGR